MLPKSQRLNLSKSFTWVAAGKKIETESFKFFIRYSDNPTPLIGIALSKNNFKKAHDRNRAKRVTSQLIMQGYSNLPSGLNLVIMPKTKVLEKESKNLLEEITSVHFTNSSD